MCWEPWHGKGGGDGGDEARNRVADTGGPGIAGLQGNPQGGSRTLSRGWVTYVCSGGSVPRVPSCSWVSSPFNNGRKSSIPLCCLVREGD